MPMRGLYTAVITPMDYKGNIDGKVFQTLIRAQREGQASGVVILGSTGEGMSLSDVERNQLIAWAIQAAQDMPIWVSVGHASTIKTIEWAQDAKQAGAKGIMVSLPFYTKPCQMGIVDHYRAIAESVDIDIMVYDVPSRCGVTLSDWAIDQLAGIKSIVAVKDATGDVRQLLKYQEQCPHWSWLAGDDALLPSWMAAQGHGVVSVLGNIFIEGIANYCRDFGKVIDSAHSSNFSIYQPAIELLSNGNPVMIKTLMHRHGCIPCPRMRLPLRLPRQELFDWCFNRYEHQSKMFEDQCPQPSMYLLSSKVS